MKGSLLRDHAADPTPRVTHVELFFDLVYVFAFIQLAHHLFEHLTMRGAMEALVLFLGVWWAWNYTAWATNWVDPEHPAVRGLVVVLMLLSLVMSVAIPGAFGDRGLVFAAAYVSLQTLRGAFMVAAFGRQRMGRNYGQLLAWTTIAGVGWIAGAFAQGEARLLLWAAAVAVDVAAPMHGFWLPGLGRTPMRDWTLAGGHLAERGQLVVLIALGESILEIGLTLSRIAWDVAVAGAFVAGFVVTVSLWWTYFVRQAEEGAHAIAAADDPARLGRAGYAYGHGIMVAGIIVVAVAVAKAFADPIDPAPAAVAALVLGGPALYLVGNALFNFTLSGRWPRSRLLAILALGLLAPVASAVSALALQAMVGALLLTLALAAGTPRRRVAAHGASP